MRLRAWLAIGAVAAAWMALGVSSAGAETRNEPTVLGSPGSGAGQFSEPSGIAVAPGGDVYVADRGNHRIERFGATGAYLGQWGENGAGAGKFGKGLVGVAIDASGRVYVLDGRPATGGYFVQRFSATGAFEKGWGTETGSALGQFDEPTGIAVGPSGSVYVSEGGGNDRVQRFDSEGGSPQAFGASELSNPVGVAVDGTSGEVFVADDDATPQVFTYGAAGEPTGSWGTTGRYEGKLPPHGLVAIAVGPEGDVYARTNVASESENNQYARYLPNGTFAGEFTWDIGAEPRGLAVGDDTVYAPMAGSGHVLVFDLRTPSASLLAPYTPVGIGQTVHFQATARALLGQVVDYEWDLDGDGVYETDTGTTPEATHVYAKAQKLTVSLRVHSSLGGIGTDSRPVEAVVPPPSGPVGVSIDGGAAYTNDPNVTVSVRWPSFDNRLMIANDGGFSPASVMPVAAKISWHLDAAGPERQPKTIYVRFGNDFEIGTQTFEDDIILDQTAPAIESAEASTRGRGRVRVYVEAVDKNSGVGAMQLRRVGHRPGKWRRYSKSIAVAHLKHGLKVRVRDRAGNDSKWVAVQRRR